MQLGINTALRFQAGGISDAWITPTLLTDAQLQAVTA